MRIFLIIFLLFDFVCASVAKIVLKEGVVNIIRDDKIIEAQKDMELFVDDVINSLEKSRVQIIFKDKTFVTLGKNSRFSINDYLYEEKKASANLSFTKGFFQVATGEIAKIAKEEFKLKTKTATIGIRGTKLEGLIEKEKETISCLRGAIWVEANGKKVAVNEGETTIVKKNMPPSNPKNLLIKKGLESFRANKFDEAYEIFGKLIEAENENPIYYYYLGKSAYMLKKYDDAIEAFNSVVRLDIDNVKGHFELGVVFYTVAEYGKSIDEFEKVLKLSNKDELKETYILSLFWLGKIYFLENDYKKANRYFDLVLEFDLDDEFKSIVLGEIKKIPKEK